MREYVTVARCFEDLDPVWEDLPSIAPRIEMEAVGFMHKAAEEKRIDEAERLLKIQEEIDNIEVPLEAAGYVKIGMIAVLIQLLPFVILGEDEDLRNLVREKLGIKVEE